LRKKEERERGKLRPYSERVNATKERRALAKSIRTIERTVFSNSTGRKAAL
jgi:hypothetical protein